MDNSISKNNLNVWTSLPRSFFSSLQLGAQNYQLGDYVFVNSEESDYMAQLVAFFEDKGEHCCLLKRVLSAEDSQFLKSASDHTKEVFLTDSCVVEPVIRISHKCYVKHQNDLPNNQAFNSFIRSPNCYFYTKYYSTDTNQILTHPVINKSLFATLMGLVSCEPLTKEKGTISNLMDIIEDVSPSKSTNTSPAALSLKKRKNKDIQTESLELKATEQTLAEEAQSSEEVAQEAVKHTSPSVLHDKNNSQLDSPSTHNSGKDHQHEKQSTLSKLTSASLAQLSNNSNKSAEDAIKQQMQEAESLITLRNDAKGITYQYSRVNFHNQTSKSVNLGSKKKEEQHKIDDESPQVPKSNMEDVVHPTTSKTKSNSVEETQSSGKGKRKLSSFSNEDKTSTRLAKRNAQNFNRVESETLSTANHSEREDARNMLSRSSTDPITFNDNELDISGELNKDETMNPIDAANSQPTNTSATPKETPNEKRKPGRPKKSESPAVNSKETPSAISSPSENTPKKTQPEPFPEDGWVGECGSDGYRAVIHEGQLYSVGDTVYMHSGENTPPFIGTIAELYQTKRKKGITTRWFYRPSDVPNWDKRKKKEYSKELFSSEDYNKNSVDAIEGKCTITQIPVHAPKPLIDSFQDKQHHYFYRQLYDPETDSFFDLKLPEVSKVSNKSNSSEHKQSSDSPSISSRRRWKKGNNKQTEESEEESNNETETSESEKEEISDEESEEEQKSDEGEDQSKQTKQNEADNHSTTRKQGREGKPENECVNLKQVRSQQTSPSSKASDLQNNDEFKTAKESSESSSSSTTLHKSPNGKGISKDLTHSEESNNSDFNLDQSSSTRNHANQQKTVTTPKSPSGKFSSSSDIGDSAKHNSNDSAKEKSTPKSLSQHNRLESVSLSQASQTTATPEESLSHAQTIMPILIESMEQYQKESMVAHDQLLVLCFFSVWGPVKHKAHLQTVCEENPDIKVLKVDTDLLPVLSNEIQLDFLPTYVFYKNGARICQLKDAGLQTLRQTIQELKIS